MKKNTEKKKKIITVNMAWAGSSSVIHHSTLQ